MKYEYKEAGLTCNDFIQKLKLKYNNKIAYTARLDPMAQGIVPILIGDECMNINNMCNTNKKYRVKVILGIKTDSDDPLGLIQNINMTNNIDSFINENKCKFECNDIIINQKFHYFSTKALKKRKQGNTNDSFHQVKLYKSKIINYGTLNFNEWRDNIITIIKKVDPCNYNRFRQKEIIEMWENISMDNIPFFELELDVSSGFFVRQFIADFNMNLMCFDINRISVYNINDEN